MKSIQIITKAIADAIIEGKERAAARQMEMAVESEAKSKEAVEEKAALN